MFRVEAVVCIGLTNPSCTSSANEWLPCRKDIEPTKIEELNFDREDFAQHDKKKRLSCSQSREKIQPISQIGQKIDFASAVEEIVPNSILFTAAPKPKIDFV